MNDQLEKRKSKLQQINEGTWLVYNSKEERIGILNRDVQSHYTFISGSTGILAFDDDTAVVKHFGNATLFEEQIKSELVVPDAAYIKGFKVAVLSPNFIEEGDALYNPELPLYTKKAGSDIAYAAGYYCLKFPGMGWISVFNSKASTLAKYQYEGPFRSEIDAKARLKALKSAAGK